jgi:hypothetical protein
MLLTLGNLDNQSFGYDSLNRWVYIADDRVADLYKGVAGLAPFGGFAIDFGDWIFTKISPYKTIDLNNSNQIFGVLSRGNHFMGSLSYFLSDVKYLGKITAWEGYVDTGLSIYSIKQAAFSKSYEIQEAVDLSGVVQSSNKECAIYMSKLAESMMKDMIENKQVKIEKNKFGLDELKINNRAAYHNYVNLLKMINECWR